MTKRYGPMLERTRRQIEQLERESESMRRRVADLQDRVAWLEARLMSANAAGQMQTEGVEARLDVLLSDLDEQIENCARERDLLANRHEFAKRSQGSSLEQLEQLEEEREILFNLWVAGAQLREAEDLARVRAAILEIVINLIGCEEVGLFEWVESDDRFVLTNSLGLDDTRSAALTLGQGFIGEQLARRSMYVGGTGPLASADERARGLTACIPFVVEGRVIGVLLMYELVPHKPQLRDRDRELIELLRVYAGPVLIEARGSASDDPEAHETWTQA